MNKPLFNVNLCNGLINVNTLSPNGIFFYRIKKPKSLNPSTFGCRISFFSISGELIYFRKGVFAHEIHNTKELKETWQKFNLDGAGPHFDSRHDIGVVKWSKQGNMVYFLEYVSKYNSKPHFESVLLVLKNKVCYRIDESVDNFQVVGELGLEDHGFDEYTVATKLDRLNIKHSPAIKNRLLSNSIFDIIYGKWYP